ncbi:hypothetical protein J3Q64DRAFT_1776186 [Phycomyces blakesleeanus]|uniref:HMG box domain-containing protein n=1 Tax=Phycomyces blakesleeanus TaxID=4837 RepID=A0ABR3AIQ8_PHYBL
MSEDKYRNRYKELKKRIRDIEEDNDMLTMKLYKARKSIRHLKLERTFLLDRVEKIQDPALDSGHSDAGSDGYLHDESEVQKYRQNGKHADSRGRIEKILSKPPRRKKDPNAPKGPGNVFFLYCRLERDKIKDEFPQENLGEVTKILGQKWKGLTKEEKQKYYDMYKKELEEYEEAMKTYTATETPTTAVATDNIDNSNINIDIDINNDNDIDHSNSNIIDNDNDNDNDIDNDNDNNMIGLSAMSSPVQSSLVEYPHHDPLEDGRLMMDDEEEEEDEEIEDEEIEDEEIEEEEIEDEEIDEEEEIESMAPSPVHESSTLTSWPTGMDKILDSKPEETTTKTQTTTTATTTSVPVPTPASVPAAAAETATAPAAEDTIHSASSPRSESWQAPVRDNYE